MKNVPATPLFTPVIKDQRENQWRLLRAVSLTFITMALDQRSLWLFEACSCKQASEGLLHL
jgi:hypothetical protein